MKDNRSQVAEASNDARRRRSSFNGRRRRIEPLLIVVGALAVAAAAHGAIPSTERDVLIALYLNTNGNQWGGNFRWCLGPCPTSGTPTFNTPGTECRWNGITCDATKSHVIDVSMQNFNLVGTLPALTGLTNLQQIDVGANRLTGAIPELAELPALVRAYFGANGFTSLPQLTGPASLQEFEAGFNQLTGSLPDLQGFTALTRFDVGMNLLSGPVPSISGMATLQSFYVADNKLTGSIPPLSVLPSLQYFDVGNNQLSGPLPDISGLPSLIYVHVQQNHLTGSLPPAAPSLVGWGSSLCPNSFDLQPTPYDAAWNWAVGQTPWWGPEGGGCDLLFSSSFE